MHDLDQNSYIGCGCVIWFFVWSWSILTSWARGPRSIPYNGISVGPILILGLSHVRSPHICCPYASCSLERGGGGGVRISTRMHDRLCLYSLRKSSLHVLTFGIEVLMCISYEPLELLSLSLVFMSELDRSNGRASHSWSWWMMNEFGIQNKVKLGD